MVSTFLSDETKRVCKKGKETEKPVYVINYNQHVVGVDLNDQLFHVYLVTERMTKRYLKIFIRLFNLTVLKCDCL